MVRGVYMVCPKCSSQIQDGLTNCPVCNEVLIVKSVNQEVNLETLENVNEIKEQPINKANNISKYKNTIIGIAGLIIFIVIGYLVFFSSSNKEVNLDKDIPTINKEETTTTSKKKTTTSSKQDETTTSRISGGASVKIGDYEYIVPVGFEFREKEEDERFDYYIMRPQASVLIGLNFIRGAETLQDIYNRIMSSYEENHTTVDTTSEVLDYEGYKYYRLSISEQDSKKKIVLHTELIIEIENGLYLDVLLYEPVNYGEQNYFQSLFKFINSRK